MYGGLVMKEHSFSLLAFLLALVCGMVIWTPSAHADNLYASIRGTVADQSGAVVPDAKLTATNIATGLSYSTTSSKDGLFAFLQLPIGDYSVKVERSGFKTFTEGHIHLDLDQIFNLTAAMQVGVVSDTITVEANSAQVETTSMQLGTTVTGNQIVELPLNGRNWTQLMQLQPGVQAASDRFGTGTFGGGFSTSGAETQQNSFLINGTDTNDTTLNSPLVVPSPDAIGQFDLVSSTLNPEYGRNSGAIVNAAIKNGTNQFHGNAFEFYRDTFLDATPWFETAPALFHQNQFGATVGGPIVKNHAFFFFSYQGTRSVTPQPAGQVDSFSGLNYGQYQPYVYSQAQRGGNFSGSGPFSSKPIPFAMFGDSASTCPVSGGAPCPANGVNTYANLFSTGNIPTQDLNPLSTKLVNQYVPLPTPGASNNAFLFNPLEVLKRDQYLGRLDEKLSEKDSIWFYGLYQNAIKNDDLGFDGSTLPGLGSANPSKTYQYTTDWNHTFSSSMLNEARFAYLRYNYQAAIPLTTQSPSAYGFTGLASTQDPAFAQLPVMAVGGLFSLGFSANGPQPRVQNTYQVVDNISKVWGHHTFKAGFNMDRLEINNPYYNSLNGTYQFFGSGPFSTGNPGADFLLGIPDEFSQGSGAIVRARGREYYSYGQDQWQVRPDLTLTLGAGWDIETPYKNLYADGKVLGAFNPGQQSTVFPTAPPGLVFPGDKGVGPYGAARVHYDDIGPRVGFAWSPGDSHKWSVRGGIGLYFNRTESEATGQTLTNAPFSLTSPGAAQIGSTPALANPYTSVNPAPVGATPSGTVNNPFPFTPPAAGSTSVNFANFEPIGLGEVLYDQHLTVPRSTNFNLNMQYQVSKSTVATVAYVGTIGRHLEGAFSLNPAGTATGNALAVSENPAAVANGTLSDLTLNTLAANTYQYNPALFGGIGVVASDWSSNYNALQAQINRHFSNGLQLQAAYTWSRYFDYTSSLENSAFNSPGFNALNFARNYGPSANDGPQRLVVNYVYTLPIYKYGRHWKQLTDGWNLSGIGTFQHGFPVAVFQQAYNELQGNPSLTFFATPAFVNATGEPLNINHNPRNSPTQQWVNPAAFAIPALGTEGTANRNPFYGPGLNYWDMALEKDLHFTEAMYIQLRLETFNTFNHANFGPPVGNFSAASFGQVNSVQQISTTGAGRVVQLGGKFYF
jgi:Carboxypeptidase regulatory-like domain